MNRNDSIGLTLVARHTGIQQASSAIKVNNSVMTMNVGGSTALTPNNIFAINHVNVTS